MSDKQVRGKYTLEYKLEAVRQVKAGQSVATVSKVLGIPKVSLSNWVRLSTKGVLSGAGDKAVPVTPEQVELARLRAEVARLRMERDIAKKAAAYFAQDTLRGTPRFTKLESNIRRASPVKCWRSAQAGTSPGRVTTRPNAQPRRGATAMRRCQLAHMRAIHAEVREEYCWPRMHKELVARGIRVGKE